MLHTETCAVSTKSDDWRLVDSFHDIQIQISPFIKGFITAFIHLNIIFFTKYWIVQWVPHEKQYRLWYKIIELSWLSALSTEKRLMVAIAIMDRWDKQT